MKSKSSKPVRIAIAIAKFNERIMKSLLHCCEETLLEGKVKIHDISVLWVPGAYELPFVANKLARSKKYDAVIGLACVIKGETSHDIHVATWAALGLGHVGLKTGVPILFGVLSPKTEAQAWKRAKPGPLNRGKEVAEAALEMVRLNRAELR